MVDLEVKPLSDTDLVSGWARYACQLMDVTPLHVIKAGYDVILSYIQSKCQYHVLYLQVYSLG